MPNADSPLVRDLSRLDDLPRVRLFQAPTPIEAMPNLGARLGDVRLHVKRDDCTGLAFGGNKVRQLEFYLGEARAGPNVRVKPFADLAEGAEFLTWKRGRK